MSATKPGPICGFSKPQYMSTPGTSGVNDSGDVTRPVLILNTPGAVRGVLLADSRNAGGTAARPSPHARPSPLQEMTEGDRSAMFEHARKCCKEATGKDVAGLDDKAALQKASVVPEVSPKAWWSHYKAEIEAKGLSMRASWDRLNGLAVPHPTNPRILMNPKFFAAAQSGGKWHGEDALLLYRDTCLEEECHLYLYFRGISPDVDAKKSAGGSGSCHHEAIPAMRRKYRQRFGKKYGAGGSAAAPRGKA